MRWLTLFLIALAASSPARAAWREASSEHFLIYSEQNEAQLKEFASRLERFDAAMRLVRGLPNEPMGAANRVTVYVVDSVAEVQKLHGPGSSRGDFRIAGFYIPRATGSLAFTPRWAGSDGKFDTDAQIVLLHEYAHDFMMRNYPAPFRPGSSRALPNSTRPPGSKRMAASASALLLFTGRTA
jgi:hypothetical protein